MKLLSEAEKLEIKNSVSLVLNREFRNFSEEKKRFKTSNNYFYFSCPICGDSHDNDRKKRGYIFYDSGYFHCYNCGERKTVKKFLESFDQTLSLETVTSLFDVASEYRIKHINQHADSLSIDSLDLVKEAAIKREDLFQHLRLRPVTEKDPQWEFIKNRNIHIFKTQIAVNGNPNRFYLFNNAGSDLILGYQTRNIDGYVKYSTYNLKSIHENIFKKEWDPKYDSINEISLFFNMFNVDFTIPFTLFEGPIDRLFMRNSIATGGVNKDTNFLDNIDAVQYLYDNDEPGHKKMFEKINKGKKVFLWQKFIDDNNLHQDYKLGRLKDMNDLFNICIRDKKNYIKDINDYFSNDPLDMIYI